MKRSLCCLRVISENIILTRVNDVCFSFQSESNNFTTNDKSSTYGWNGLFVSILLRFSHTFLPRLALIHVHRCSRSDSNPKPFPCRPRRPTFKSAVGWGGEGVKVTRDINPPVPVIYHGPFDRLDTRIPTSNILVYGHTRIAIPTKVALQTNG